MVLGQEVLSLVCFDFSCWAEVYTLVPAGGMLRVGDHLSSIVGC